ncbi:unnamed protein product [Aureobasidium uvarum]|uniref:Uncharacterized protein n=1 Tax=Aureobasidium uvarum TaxID=2773716 RepID=A0A9N8KUG7_9PEZI|nr:unnamed protein product [Aureobasidium uvarum]
MVVIKAIAHRNTAELASHLHDQRPHPPRNFVPELVEGAQVKPCTGWMNLTKPPPDGWWADRQSCQCPPCYFYKLTDQINSGILPFAVAVPLAQLINVGLIRLNFRHAEHTCIFTAEDKDYALSLHRDVCYGINSGQSPLQLLEILLVASRKAVLKPLDPQDPEYHHKEFEMCLKRAVRRCKEDISNGQGHAEDEEQTQEGAHQDDDDDDQNSGALTSDGAECENVEHDDADKETYVKSLSNLRRSQILTCLQCYLMDGPFQMISPLK